MKILLLGVGMQGKAALHDLVQSDEVTEIVAADQALDELRDYLLDKDYGPKVRLDTLNHESESAQETERELLPGVERVGLAGN